MIDQLIQKGVVRCKEIIDIFGPRLSVIDNKFQLVTAQGQSRNVDFCRKVFMEDKYIYVLYVIEEEVASFHSSHHSWVNGFFKYTEPHALYVVGTCLFNFLLNIYSTNI